MTLFINNINVGGITTFLFKFCVLLGGFRSYIMYKDRWDTTIGSPDAKGDAIGSSGARKQEHIFLPLNSGKFCVREHRSFNLYKKNRNFHLRQFLCSC